MRKTIFIIKMSSHNYFYMYNFEFLLLTLKNQIWKSKKEACSSAEKAANAEHSSSEKLPFSKLQLFWKKLMLRRTYFKKVAPL